MATLLRRGPLSRTILRRPTTIVSQCLRFFSTAAPCASPKSDGKEKDDDKATHVAPLLHRAVLDYRSWREDPIGTRENAARRKAVADVDRVVALSEEAAQLRQHRDALRHTRNTLALRSKVRAVQ